jgi:ubiquinol-cytochrome c reductase cytochrome b subunit
LWGGLTAKSMAADASDEAFQRARKLASQRADRATKLFVQGVPPEGPLAMLRHDPESRGQEVFIQNCATCHRFGDLAPADGKATAPELTGFGTKAWVIDLLENPDADRYFGKTPFKGQMPSFVHPPPDPEVAKGWKAMPEAEQEAVATFLAAEAKSPGSGKGTPGEKIVSHRCTSCHRLDGKTDDEDSLAPELRGWGSAAWIEAQTENPGSGKTYPKGAMAEDLKGHMPAFGEKISAADRKLLVAWLVGKR